MREVNKEKRKTEGKINIEKQKKIKEKENSIHGNKEKGKEERKEKSGIDISNS